MADEIIMCGIKCEYRGVTFHLETMTVSEFEEAFKEATAAINDSIDIRRYRSDD